MLCVAIQEMMKDAEDVGLEKGRIEILASLVKDGTLSMEAAAKK